MVAFTAGAVAAMALAPFDFIFLLWISFPTLVWMIDANVAPQQREPGADLGPQSASLRRHHPLEGRGIWRADAARQPVRMRGAANMIRFGGPGWFGAAVIGWWFGFGYFTLGLYWIASSFLVDAGNHAWMLPALLLLPAGLALFFAIGAGLAALIWSPGPCRVAALAGGLGIGEWLRATVFTGFPWNNPGQVLASNPELLQVAALVGPPGLAVLTIGVFALPAAIIRDGRWASRWPLALSPALLAMIYMFGVWWLNHSNDPSGTVATATRVRLVQPNIEQALKWRPELRQQHFTTLLQLSRDAVDTTKPPVSAIIWPETAIPFLLPKHFDLDIWSTLPAPLIAGAQRYQLDGKMRASFYNSVYLIAPNAAPKPIYDKLRLVPFGEFMPFQRSLERLGISQLTKLPGGFSAGTRRQPVDLGPIPAFIPLICYEVIFPVESAAYSERPDWLLNLTNDAWFGHSSGPYQHLRQAQLAAVAEGLPLVRVANTGISALIDANGRILAQIDLGKRGAIDVDLPPPQALPITAGWGQAIGWGIAILAVLSGLAGRIRASARP